MKVEYFPMKNWYISERNMELFEDRVQPCPLKSFKVSSAVWMASYSVYRVSEKHQVRNFRLPGSA